MPILLQDLLEFGYLRCTLAALLLASVACGIVGGYVVARRQSYMIGAISHSLIGGVGLARYLQVVHALTWFTPILGAVLAAVCASVSITLLTLRARARLDAVLSAVWTLGVALGITFISLTPGYAEDLNSYLFGSILLVSPSDLAVMAALDLFIVVCAFLLHNRLLAYCFRPETIELRGLSATGTALLLNLLIALTVVLLAQVVGIVLVLVLLVLPAATVSTLSHRLSNIMALAGVLSLALSLAGLAISYQYDLPAGATIVELTVAAFLAASVIRAIRRRLARRQPTPTPQG